MCGRGSAKETRACPIKRAMSISGRAMRHRTLLSAATAVDPARSKREPRVSAVAGAESSSAVLLAAYHAIHALFRAESQSFFRRNRQD